MITIGKLLTFGLTGLAFLFIGSGFLYSDTVWQEISAFTLAGALLLAAVVVMLGVIVAHIERLKRV